MGYKLSQIGNVSFFFFLVFPLLMQFRLCRNVSCFFQEDMFVNILFQARLTSFSFANE